jgi:hypothetical protein
VVNSVNESEDEIYFQIESEPEPKRKDFATLNDFMIAHQQWAMQNIQEDKTLIEINKAKEFRRTHDRLRNLIKNKNKQVKTKIEALNGFIKSYLSETQITNPDVKKLLDTIRTASTSKDIENIFNAVYNIIIDRQIKNGNSMTKDLLAIKATKKNSKGQREGRNKIQPSVSRTL